MLDKQDKIILAGAAGLVGQNLAVLLEQAGFHNLVGIDKHPHNTGVLRALHPRMQVIEGDLAMPGPWEDALPGARALVMLQAQIGGESLDAFQANNIRATNRVLAACRAHGVEHIVHISSSVLNSRANDFYTETKKAQEDLVRASGIPHQVLRPTLMFGWLDRKHLGWLSRFMARSLVFPIPGTGRFARQPLYVRDFCRIILACLQREPDNGVFDISGLEVVDYIDIIRQIKRVTGARALVLRIPYWLFWTLLAIYALFDRDPPFTTRQLAALVIPELFPMEPWGDVFGVTPTTFAAAIQETFGPSPYRDVVLDF